MKNIVLQLFDTGAFKFGSFVLKSGAQSPVYIDLRECISSPPLLRAIAEAMWEKVAHLSFDRICGVPYTALPMASYLSIAYNIPMVMRRKEAKLHGTKKLVEGVFQPNQVCLILEDLITSGTSILETTAPLEEAGMRVKDVVVFLDREQGGRRNLESRGYRLHSVITLGAVLDILVENGRIGLDVKESVLEYTREAINV